MFLWFLILISLIYPLNFKRKAKICKGKNSKKKKLLSEKNIGNFGQPCVDEAFSRAAAAAEALYYSLAAALVVVVLLLAATAAKPKVVVLSRRPSS